MPTHASKAGPADTDRLPHASLDAARLAAWRAITETYQTVRAAVAEVLERESGLPLDSFEVLLILREKGDRGVMLQRELEDELPLSQSGLSRLLKRVEQGGFVERRPSAADRRAADVALTGAGADALRRATPIYLSAVQGRFGAWLDDPEATTIAVGLGKALRGTGGRSASAAAAEDHLVPFGESVLSTTTGALAVADALTVRDALEPMMLEEARRNRTDEVIRDMFQAVGRMARSLDDAEEFFRSDWQLHRVMARVCHNDTLRVIYIGLLDIVEKNLESVVPTRGLDEYLRQRLAVHVDLVEAVASGDAQRVADAGERHRFIGARPHMAGPTPA